ncbi:MAG: hypothetical protein IT181_24610 [Acidobacteria bacterium]|nr:hypothetical protein [Acidobacteriota bacterium]
MAAAIGLGAVMPVGVRTEGLAKPESGPFITRHPELRAALERIARGSASWRTALASVAATGRSALVVTPEDVVVADPAGEARAAFDRSEVAAVSPVADSEGRVGAVLVVVNVDQIQAAHERLSSLPGEFHADLERVLAHEVYGHAVPYLLSGDLSGRCADPLPGTPAAAACAIQRENVIRAELRLGRRTDGTLSSLSLSRLLRH